MLVLAIKNKSSPSKKKNSLSSQPLAIKLLPSSLLKIVGEKVPTKFGLESKCWNANAHVPAEGSAAVGVAVRIVGVAVAVYLQCLWKRANQIVKNFRHHRFLEE